MGEISEEERVSWDGLAVTLIITSNICFYTQEALKLYMLMTIVGCGIAWINNFKYFSFKVLRSNCILWLTFIYAIFFFYGFLFLQGGVFSWDSFLIRYIENISLYLSISGLFRERGANVVRPFIISGILAMLYLVAKESVTIISGGIRIGNSLSGNVNTVGFNFGFISLLVTWQYCNTKKKSNIALLALLSFLMLLTGSKKALLIVVLDLILIFVYQKNKVSAWLKLGLVVAIGVYVIFNVPYFYNILGYRIETMMITLIEGSSAVKLSSYSYSTEMRKVMIKEAFGFFLQHPIFGGGFNYFFANTVTQYEYSHCNYTEMLCSFGLMGTGIYYLKQFSNVKFVLRARLLAYEKYRNIAIIVLALMFEMAVVDWATVTFSGQCMGYIPIVFTCAALDFIRCDMRDNG